jgi:hypothetical protein
MKLTTKIAVATAGLALLGSVGTRRAAAADFNLSGSFTDSHLNSPYDNGNFSGTYSIADSASYGPNVDDPDRNPGGLVATLSQFDINFFSKEQSKLQEISSVDPNWLVKEKFFNPPMGVWGLTLVNLSSQEKFSLLFAGTALTPQTQQGAVLLSGDLEQPFATTIATVQTATSTPAAVPEPSNVSGVCLLGLFGLGGLMKKKVVKSQAK